MWEPNLHSTEDGPIVRNRSAIWLKSSYYRCFCVNRVLKDPLCCHNKNFTPTLLLAVLCTFITGYEPRTQFAFSITAEQVFRAQNFSQLKLKRGSSGLKLKSSRQLVPRWVKELWWSIKEYNGSVEGQESTSRIQKIEMFKARSATAKKA